MHPSLYSRTVSMKKTKEKPAPTVYCSSKLDSWKRWEALTFMPRKGDFRFCRIYKNILAQKQDQTDRCDEILKFISHQILTLFTNLEMQNFQDKILANLERNVNIKNFKDYIIEF